MQVTRDTAITGELAILVVPKSDISIYQGWLILEQGELAKLWTPISLKKIPQKRIPHAIFAQAILKTLPTGL